MTAGEIVLAYNLPDVPELKLSREAYSAIFLGEITNWNDQRIAATNEGVTLPDMPITVVVRSDSSGTTFNFTSHLSAISEGFKGGPGAGTSVQWPSSDKIIKAPKNDGVTATILQTPGAIGYVEYGYAKLTGAPMATLENKAGEYVPAGGSGGAEALTSAQFDDYMRAFITDPEGADAYPIATFTWMIFHKDGQDPEKVAAIKQMVEYGLTDGQALAEELGYIPMPEAVIEQVRAAAEQIGAGS
jgi:phosphate transport system substrate-binding protein